MQKANLTFLFIFCYQLTILSVFAQAPEKMSYQAIIRDNKSALVTNTVIGIRISILQTSGVGTPVYVETHTPTTNKNGLVSIEIGGGTVVSGSFSSINWANVTYFLKIETDPTGGTNYSISGTSQLLSVPYALHAKTADKFTGTLTETQKLADVLTLGNSANNQIKNVTDPTDEQDVATKAYVDVLKQQLTELEGLLYQSGFMRITDIDGNSYKIVKIGNQIWMAENLTTTRYNDGTPINRVVDESSWAAMSSGAYCWNLDDSARYENNYGKLYNGYAILTDKLCPTGWHVPTNDEWTELINYLGGTEIAGGKLKITGTELWKSPNTGATNESGFSGLPGGRRDSNGGFVATQYSGTYTTSTTSSGNIIFWSLLYDNANIYSLQYNYKFGFSVRCLKD